MHLRCNLAWAAVTEREDLRQHLHGQVPTYPGMRDKMHILTEGGYENAHLTVNAPSSGEVFLSTRFRQATVVVVVFGNRPEVYSEEGTN